jgi:hypothetical protein
MSKSSENDNPSFLMQLTFGGEPPILVNDLHPEQFIEPPLRSSKAGCAGRYQEFNAK